MSKLTEQTRVHLQNHHNDFEDFAKIMVDTHHGRFDEVFWAVIKKHCNKTPETIVDLGTGPALLLKDLREVFPESRLIGVEAQPAMIEYAQKILNIGQLDKIELINHDLSMPNIKNISDESADICIASMLIHELQVPTILIKEMERILKPGGTAIVYDWHRHNLRAYSPTKCPSTLNEFTHFSEHCRYDQEDMIYLFEEAGFEILESMVRKRGKHILLTAQKQWPN